MNKFMALALGATLLLGQAEYARQDALIFQANYFPPLDTLTMARYWSATAGRSESIYNGNGSWGLGYADWPNQPYDADHPLVRVVARHALGLLLLIDAGLADSSAVRRARMALNWLLERQTPEGAWPLYTVNRGVVSVNSVYPTALAARALSRGHRLFDNPRYQLAATQAAIWQELRPATESPLHHGLVLAQLLEHFRSLDHQMHLDRAVDLGMQLITSQRPNGSWNDSRPVHTDEHAIIAEALLLLEQALAGNHPHKRRIAAATTGALNFLLESQRKDGNFNTAVDETLATKVPTFELTALMLGRKTKGMPEFDMPIAGAVRAMHEHASLMGNLWRGSQDGRFLGMANALVWFTTTYVPPPKPSRREYLPLGTALEGTAAESPAFQTGDTDTQAIDSVMPSPILPADSTIEDKTPAESLAAPDSIGVPPAGSEQ